MLGVDFPGLVQERCSVSDLSVTEVTAADALKGIRTFYGAAMRAYRAIRPAQALEIFARFGGVGEMGL